MRPLGYFARRRARESAVSEAELSSALQPVAGDSEPGADDQREDRFAAISSEAPDADARGGEDLRDLAALIQGALQQGNATADVDGETIDLGDGLRGLMFEPLGSNSDPEAGPGKD